MPLILKHKTPEGAEWAAWQIAEPEEALRQAIAMPNSLVDEGLEAIKVEQRRLEWLACRLALQALGPEEVGPQRLLKGENGKPFLHELPLQVSLSHAWPYAVAIIHHKPVGIDIEVPRHQLNRIQHKFVNDTELVSWNKGVTDLCQLWTAKEALYKAHGKAGIIFSSEMMVSPLAEGATEQMTKGYVQEQEFTLRWHQFENHYCCLAL